MHAGAIYTVLAFLSLAGCMNGAIDEPRPHHAYRSAGQENTAMVAASHAPARDPRTSPRPLAPAAARTTDDIRGTFGTFANPPRKADGTKDLDRLLAELVELKVNTYNYLIYHDADDWDALKTFLPMAQERRIDVWVTVMPPSGSYPFRSKYSEPYRLNFTEWARAIAKLSLKHPNLVAWSIDDFTTDLKYFTPRRVRMIRDAAGEVNRALAFVPTCYYRETLRETARDYEGLADGILFPYRAESGDKYNVTDATRLEAEIKALRRHLGPGMPIVVDVYASRLGNLPEATPEYVQKVMRVARKFADGVHVFRHPVAGTEKWSVEKELFHKWAAEDASLEGGHR